MNANNEHPSVLREDTKEILAIAKGGVASIRKSAIVAHTAALAIIQTWLFSAMFLPGVFVFDSASFFELAVFQEISILSYVVATASGYILRGVSQKTWRRLTTVLLFLTPTWIGFYLAVSLLGASAGLLNFLSVISHVLFGSSLGMAFVTWVRVYVRYPKNSAVYVGCAFAVSVALVMGLNFVPMPISTVVVTLMPLAIVMLLQHSAATVQQLEDYDDLCSTELGEEVDLPKRLWLCVNMVGFVFGLSYGYLASNVVWLGECAISCLIVTFAASVAFVLYYLRTGRNPGYAIPLSVVFTLTCAGQGLVSVFRDTYLGFAIAPLFAGQLILQFILLMQLPVIFGKRKSLTAFFGLWTGFMGTQLVGILLRHFLLSGLSIGFEAFSAIALVFSIGVMGYSLQDSSVSTAWDYIPFPTYTRRRFAAACDAVKEKYGLTPREREIMAMVGRGRNGTFIQEKLVISKSTYQTHMRNLYKKLDIHSDQELIDIIESELRAQLEPKES